MAETSLPPAPVIKVTRYDEVSSWLIALVLALGASAACLGVIWVSLQPARSIEPIPVELVEVPGGVEDGAISETLRLDSPEPEALDPSLAEIEAPESEIQETLDSVMEFASEATNQAEKQFELDARHAGKRGSAKGTGRRALGMGPGEAGIPREQRWFVSFSDRATLSEYAAQLDFFGIELGALLPDGKLVYVSKLTAPRPETRTTTQGGNEKRLYMIWQGGQRKQADLQLFQKTGLDVGQGVVFQFYPLEVEQQLATLERQYRNRKVDEIRRTYFAVQPSADGTGYEFVVTRQAYFQ